MLKELTQTEERYYMASQATLMWRKFKKHQLAITGGIVLAILYFMALFCEFLAPYDPIEPRIQYMESPPQRVYLVDAAGRFHLRPFVYPLRSEIDRRDLRMKFTADTSKPTPVKFFVHGDTYKMWGLFESDLHLFGADGAPVILFGTDKLGRDMFSRILYASRISLSISLVGVFLSFVLGVAIGGISGYFGGYVDLVIQRIIEFLIVLPKIPLWMGLAAALPADWPSLRVYFGITIILSLLGWPGLARVVRGKFLTLIDEDFVLAARLAGAKDGYIIARHLVPSFLSYLIVSITLAIPAMILGETALSFLGLGIQPPSLSWGVLLQDAQSIRSLAQFPWLLIPAGFVILTVLAFNILGDGLRDAADPYK